MIKIRKATLEDLRVVPMLVDDFEKESSRYKHLGLNKEKVIKTIERFIKDDSHGVVLVAEYNENFAGGFVGGLSDEWQSDNQTAFDMVNYIYPPFRSMGVGIEIAKHFIEWGKSKGAKIIQCGTATGVNTEHAVKLYSSLGFKEIGVFMELNV